MTINYNDRNFIQAYLSETIGKNCQIYHKNNIYNIIITNTEISAKVRSQETIFIACGQVIDQRTGAENSFYNTPTLCFDGKTIEIDNYLLRNESPEILNYRMVNGETRNFNIHCHESTISFEIKISDYEILSGEFYKNIKLKEDTKKTITRFDLLDFE